MRDTRGDTTTVPVRLVATEARSDVETIFPHIPAIIIVPEVRISTTNLFFINLRNLLSLNTFFEIMLYFACEPMSSNTTTGCQSEH